MRGWCGDEWGTFRERIAHGAWAATLRNSDHLKLTINHQEDCESILARTSSGRLHVFETERGLEFSAHIGSASSCEDLWRQVRDGNVSRMSFMFYDDPQLEDEWDVGDDGIYERTITDFGLPVQHFACVVNPAYEATTLEVAERMTKDGDARSAVAEAERMRAENRRRRLRNGAAAIAA